MNYSTINKRNQRKDKRRSIIITILITLLFFIFIYFYKFTKITQKEQVVTTMLINFGDNKSGQQSEEPANQSPIVEPKEEPQPEKTEPIIPPTLEKPKPVEAVKEKIITGKNEKVEAKKVEKASKIDKKEKTTKETKTKTPKETKPTETKKEKNNNSTAKSQAKQSSTPQPNSAVGNLIKGRGNKQGSQGNDTQSGNSGDPLGGDGNGDSKIGVDRKLIAFIPGTMGRGGTQPTHNCSASGTITISFIVDKAGNVTSARRQNGISDVCIVNTTISWVKKYVKAEKSTTSSTGTYSITF